MALLLCHGVLLAQVVTSQLPRPVNPAPTEEIAIQAAQQEKIGDVYHLRGNVIMHFRDLTMRADEITYHGDTGEVEAHGHLVLDGGPHDEHIGATHGTYNTSTDIGKFYNVVGTTGVRFHSPHVLLTSSNPFSFSGKEVDKIGRDRFVVRHGVVTSCEMPKPRWTFNTERANVVIGEDAKLYHSDFRFFRIPIFYFPYAKLPVERVGRQTGFLIPVIGQSSIKGTIIGDSVYWAINRSMDATIGGEYFSHRGWSQHGIFRARPSETSTVEANYFGVLDRGFGNPHVNQGGEDVRLSAEAKLPFGFRGVADLDYLSSYVFRLAFSETFTQAVNSEVKSVAFASKAYNGNFLNLMASRYQNFLSNQLPNLTTAQTYSTITIAHIPSLDVNSVDQKLGSTPVYWGYDAEVGGVTRREPDFVTGTLVGRFDVNPRASLPFHLGQWDFRPDIAVDETYYGESRVPGVNGAVGAPSTSPVTRRAFEGSFEVRPPSLSRVFDKPVFGHKLKHTIEPIATYRFVGGINNFNQLIRFDSRDILSDTNEIEYGFVNRIYAKRTRAGNCKPNTEPSDNGRVEKPGGAADEQMTNSGTASPQATTNCAAISAKELLSWEIVQKYFLDPSFGGAVIPGVRNVFTATEELTGFAFITAPRNFSPIVSRLRVHYGRDTDIEWHLDYDPKTGRIDGSTALINHRIRDFFVAGSHAYIQPIGEVVTTSLISPSVEVNQFRWLMGYGNPNKRGISAATNIGFDVFTRALQYTAVQTSYNWDCCGLSVEYRRLALGSVRNENQYRFALNLTNIGTFGTLRRQERLF